MFPTSWSLSSKRVIPIAHGHQCHQLTERFHSAGGRGYRLVLHLARTISQSDSCRTAPTAVIMREADARCSRGYHFRQKRLRPMQDSPNPTALPKHRYTDKGENSSARAPSLLTVRPSSRPRRIVGLRQATKQPTQFRLRRVSHSHPFVQRFPRIPAATVPSSSPRWAEPLRSRSRFPVSCQEPYSGQAT